MSTILKALKQAEKGNYDQGNESRPSFNVRKALSSRIEKKKNNNFLNSGRIMMVVVLVLVIIIVMAIFLYSFFPVNKTVQLQTPSADKQSRVSAIHPDNGKDQKQPFSDSVTKSSNLAETSIKIPPKPVGKSSDLSISPNKTALKPESANRFPIGDTYSNNAKEKTVRPFDTNFSKETKKSSPLKTADELEKIIDDNPPLVVGEPPLSSMEANDSIKDEKEGLAQDAPNRKILPLENNALKIQAISWAQEPKNRIAVIDNSVLRQGDSVQGYRLVEIEKDSVILQYSGKDYRLRFKYR